MKILSGENDTTQQPDTLRKRMEKTQKNAVRSRAMTNYFLKSRQEVLSLSEQPTGEIYSNSVMQDSWVLGSQMYINEPSYLFREN